MAFKANQVGDKIEFSGFDSTAAKIWFAKYTDETQRNFTGKAPSYAQALQDGKISVDKASFAGCPHWVVKLFDGFGDYIAPDKHYSPDPDPNARIPTPANGGWAAIKYIFVLMMENRSFDHMLGALGLTNNKIDGVQNVPADQKQYVIAGPPDPFLVDPGHEFDHVHGQLFGSPVRRTDPAFDANDSSTPTMSGFMDVYKTRLTDTVHDFQVPVRGFLNKVQAAVNQNSSLDCQHYAECVMKYFADGSGGAANLQKLAKKYAVCDRWFSSLPGPTIPNRLFLHAGTSGGMAYSPDCGGKIIPGQGFRFNHGTIYSAIDNFKKTNPKVDWRIYHNGGPNSQFLDGLPSLSDNSNFKNMSAMQGELSTVFPTLDKAYVLIEPNYGHITWAAWSDAKERDSIVDDPTVNFGSGNSQHPVSSASIGDDFIKKVYDTISGSPIWKNSMLIITYDEHGGFYDHVPPPDNVAAPADQNYANDKASASDRPEIWKFKFHRLGVRVPAVICSPWIAQGTCIGSADSPATVYDHTTVIKTVMNRFGMTIGPTTARVQAATDLSKVFGGPLRTDTAL